MNVPLTDWNAIHAYWIAAMVFGGLGWWWLCGLAVCIAILGELQ